MERDEANGGLFLPSDTFTIRHRGLIIQLAARYGVPALYAHDFFPRDGGLASYSVAVGERRRGDRMSRAEVCCRPVAVVRRSDGISARRVLKDVGERGARKFQLGADFAAFDEQHASES